jgi:hypothetical protein
MGSVAHAVAMKISGACATCLVEGIFDGAVQPDYSHRLAMEV